MKFISSGVNRDAATTRQVLFALRVVVASGVLFFTAAASLPLAAADFPVKPVRLLVPFPPGGTLDVVARMLAAKLRDAWNQPVVVENRVGGNGALGVDAVAKSAPDGYTMVFNATPIVTLPHLQKTPYDVTKDLTALIQTAVIDYVLAASTKSGINTVAELVDRARKSPGALNYASGGNGSGLHLNVELFKSITKTRITHIPYKGNAPAIQALLSGEVDLIFDTASAMIPMVKGGKAKALMVTGAKPLDGLPGVPAIDTLYPGSGIDGWHGIFGPAGIPPDVAQQIARDVRAILFSAEMSSRFQEMGFKPTGVSGDEFAATVRRDYERWGRVIRDNGIRAD